jgi:hypothetical protein
MCVAQLLGSSTPLLLLLLLQCRAAQCHGILLHDGAAESCLYKQYEPDN